LFLVVIKVDSADVRSSDLGDLDMRRVGEDQVKITFVIFYDVVVSWLVGLDIVGFENYCFQVIDDRLDVESLGQWNEM